MRAPTRGYCSSCASPKRAMRDALLSVKCRPAPNGLLDSGLSTMTQRPRYGIMINTRKGKGGREITKREFYVLIEEGEDGHLIADAGITQKEFMGLL